jgi:hypothetical protein
MFIPSSILQRLHVFFLLLWADHRGLQFPFSQCWDPAISSKFLTNFVDPCNAWFSLGYTHLFHFWGHMVDWGDGIIFIWRWNAHRTTLISGHQRFRCLGFGPGGGAGWECTKSQGLCKLLEPWKWLWARARSHQ